MLLHQIIFNKVFISCIMFNNPCCVFIFNVSGRLVLWTAQFSPLNSFFPAWAHHSCCRDAHSYLSHSLWYSQLCIHFMHHEFFHCLPPPPSPPIATSNWLRYNHKNRFLIYFHQIKKKRKKNLYMQKNYLALNWVNIPVLLLKVTGI